MAIADSLQWQDRCKHQVYHAYGLAEIQRRTIEGEKNGGDKYSRSDPEKVFGWDEADHWCRFLIQIKAINKKRGGVFFKRDLTDHQKDMTI